VKNFILQLLLDRMLTKIQHCVVHRRCSVMHGNQLTQHLGSGIILFLVITVLLNVNTTPLQHLFPTYFTYFNVLQFQFHVLASHPTQSRLFRGQSLQPITWPDTDKHNSTGNYTSQIQQRTRSQAVDRIAETVLPHSRLPVAY